jgi:hypothetical protein
VDGAFTHLGQCVTVELRGDADQTTGVGDEVGCPQDPNHAELVRDVAGRELAIGRTGDDPTA